ncbi:MAG: MrpF/PhaF family protein [Desulfocapsaceae bacterium]|nr:MrpF/PhaF family protein [Desulfocapsaceae bacterium]
MGLLMQVASAILLLILVVGLAMIFRVKSRSEKIMVTQFLATVSIGWLLLKGQLSGKSYLFDVSLLFALLATVITVAFVYFKNGGDEEGHDSDHH